MRILALLFSVMAGPVLAHEFWLEPTHYQIAVDGSVEANIVNGQEFEGVPLAFFPRSIEHFVIVAGDIAQTVESRMGDRPALNQTPIADGLHIAAYQSTDSTVTYETWEKFQGFVDHKDFGDVLSRHQERGLPVNDVKEVYSRYSKTLIGVGSSAGTDRRMGLETELVSLTNPYVDDVSNGMRVQLFYQNDVRTNVQVEVFDKAQNGDVIITYYQTDNTGVAQFPVTAGHSYMVDAVVLREPNQELTDTTGAVWETLWANLTFGVPE